jgi:type II secretory pathway pseudopilin PulG
LDFDACGTHLSSQSRSAEDDAMEPKPRHRFTLIELLVVIVVLGFLLVLLFPALVNPPVGQRRAHCMNNEHQIALALLNYEATHKHFPGYANRILTRPEGTRLASSWLVPILGLLDRSDLDEEWKKGKPQVVDLGFTRCPSAARMQPFDQSVPYLNFVVNCGLPGDSDIPSTGVFHNHNVDGQPVYVSLDYLAEHDGAQHTLMLSENLQAGLWTDTEEANVGMVWFREPDECSAINKCRDVGQRPQNIRYARPSSNHPGGVLATFCDGHTQFLSEQIDYSVYQHLMTPDDKGAGLPGRFDPAVLERGP